MLHIDVMDADDEVVYHFIPMIENDTKEITV